MKFYTVQPTTTTLLVFGILLALLSQPVYGQAVGTRKILQILRSRSVLNRSYIKTSDGLMMPRREKMKCRLWQNHIHHEDKSKVSHRWECSVDQPKIEGYINKVIVGIDNQNMNDFLEANGAESGKSMLVMSDMDVQEDRIVIDTDQVIRIEDYVPVEGESTGRRLTPTNGILNTLVVRVNTQDRSPPSASQLSSDIFKDDYCLKSQYGKCSYDKLQVMEYESESIAGVPTAADGVIDIEVPATSEGSSKEDIQDLALVTYFSKKLEVTTNNFKSTRRRLAISVAAMSIRLSSRTHSAMEYAAHGEKEVTLACSRDRQSSRVESSVCRKWRRSRFPCLTVLFQVMSQVMFQLMSQVIFQVCLTLHQMSAWTIRRLSSEACLGKTVTSFLNGRHQLFSHIAIGKLTLPKTKRKFTSTAGQRATASESTRPVPTNFQ